MVCQDSGRGILAAKKREERERERDRGREGERERGREGEWERESFNIAYSWYLL